MAAGKPMNVSRALAWMGMPSIAAGLWGKDDADLVRKSIPKIIKPRLTVNNGSTRRNITVVDTTNSRDMHFRSPSTLATRASLRKVLSDIKALASKGSICVFAGSMPGGDLLSQCESIIQACREKGAQVVLDTSGVALKKLLAKGSFELIKPNLDELRQVTGLDIPDRTGQIIAAAKSLLNRTKYVLVSRGPKGALLISKEKLFSAVCLSNRKAVNTVACGDYLLAGFLNEFIKSHTPGAALQAAVISATAKAWGMENMNFSKIKKSITIEVKAIK